jgi:hypothetical protein
MIGQPMPWPPYPPQMQFVKFMASAKYLNSRIHLTHQPAQESD